MEIDWSKEKAVKNFCGYCTGTPAASSCDGSCFKESYTDKAKSNRAEHTLEMLKRIPEQIEQLKKKEQDYLDSL